MCIRDRLFTKGTVNRATVRHVSELVGSVNTEITLPVLPENYTICALVRYIGNTNNRRILTTDMINPRTKLNGNLDEFSGGVTFFGHHGEKNNNSNNAFKRVGTVWSDGIPDANYENRYTSKAGFMTTPWADLNSNNNPNSYWYNNQWQKAVSYTHLTLPTT